VHRPCLLFAVNCDPLIGSGDDQIDGAQILKELHIDEQALAIMYYQHFGLHGRELLWA
jgi:hypothetical protein